jgi:hypothetical protein
MPGQAVADMLRQQIMGFRLTQMIYVAAKLGLAEHLNDGAQPTSVLASRVGAHPAALYRLLRALASVGLFAETTDGAFELTPPARLLAPDVPGSFHGLALLYGDEWLYRAYGRLLFSVETGSPAFDHVHGQSFYGYLAAHEDAAACFDGAMSAYSRQEAAGLLDAYDFTDVTRVVDVGGGHGALVVALLDAYPSMSAILFDMPRVIAEARPSFEAQEDAGRVQCVAGDFFHGVPAGGDLYLLKSILHNWDDDRCISILKHCRDAITPSGRLLIAERVIPTGNGPDEAKLFDINMLVVIAGQERTEAEFEHLLHAAGFRPTRRIATATPLTLIEAVPEPG